MPCCFLPVQPQTDIFNNLNLSFWEYMLPGTDAYRCEGRARGRKGGGRHGGHRQCSGYTVGTAVSLMITFD